MLRRFSYVGFVAAILAALLIVLPAGAQDVIWPTDGWQTSTPEAQGMMSGQLAAFFETWSQDYLNLDSLIVVRNGYIVAEAYTPLNNPDLKHNLYSVTKSFTGALIGVMLQDGLLEGLDTPVLELFPDRTVQNVDERKTALTVRDLLTMSPGLECNDMQAGFLERGTSDLMEEAADDLQFALDLPMAAAPGEVWNYCNTFTQILSGIITEKTGMTALDYASEKLFKPLGITDVAWAESQTGLSLGYSGLYLTPRDMAKFGYLYLKQGQWAGEQIIPADYAAASLSSQIKTPWDAVPYGYLWWGFDPVQVSYALGYGGQYILLVPNSDLVVVLTGGVTEAVRPAINAFPMFFAAGALSVSDTALPENPKEVSHLEQVITNIGSPDPQPVPELPALAAQISRKSYMLTSPRLFISSKSDERFMNYKGLTAALDVQKLVFTFDDSDESLLTVNFVNGETWAIPLGLDGLYRESDGPFGPVGAKAVWLDDSTFRVYLKHVGETFLHRFDFNFKPGTLDIISFETASAGANAIMAWMMP